MNEILEHIVFTAALEACTHEELDWIERIKDQLRENLRIGDVLQFYWFREKRFKGRRVYFIINEYTNKALLVAISGKKGQQKIIDFIVKHREEYFQYLR